MGPDDLLLISRPCEPSEMTDTGYMSYRTSLDSLSAWMGSVLGISSIELDINQLSVKAGYLWQFKEMLDAISVANPSAIVDNGDNYKDGKFNPYVISAIYTSAGTIISGLSGYRFADAMSNIFSWKKFDGISASNGQFDNIHSTRLGVDDITVTNGVFTNLSAASKLSAANLSSTNIASTNITSTNITASDLTATNADINSLTVGGRPYQHLSVMT